MKLDVNQLRYLTNEEFRVLTAIEMGMKNHELVPSVLIERIAALRHGGTQKLLKNLLKIKLVHHDSKKYDGYFLLYPGYDYLALKTFAKRNLVAGVGRQIGVGKESDIYVVINEQEEELVLKCQRLGRISFRQIKNKRDYFQGTKPSNWLYISRLGALKEFAFMKALYEEGFPTPVPISHNRHCVLMSKVNGYPLVQVREMAHPEAVFKKCVDLIVRMAQAGLIHGDFNEFNVMGTDSEDIIMIDFPQMISTNHPDAEEQYYRDLDCIHAFFNKRFGVVSDYYPNLADIVRTTNLDSKIEASGFTKEMAKEFDEAMMEQDKEDKENEDEEITTVNPVEKKEILSEEPVEKKVTFVEPVKNLITVSLFPEQRIHIDLIPKKKRILCRFTENSSNVDIRVEFAVPFEENIQTRYSGEEIKKKIKRQTEKKQYKKKKVGNGNSKKGKESREFVGFVRDILC